jgi:hypothetical protein
MILGSRWQRIVAGVVVTAVTVAVIGVVLLTSTPLGCGPAKAIHVTLASNRCANVASTISNPSPFPTFLPDASPLPGQPASPYPVPTANPNPEPTSSNPYPQPGSANPYPQPASNAPFPDASSYNLPPFTSPPGTPATLGLDMNCRLPIYSGGSGSGGFIMFPSGSFIADPRSAVTVTGSPGFFGLSYDRAYSRWLPVPYRWVTASQNGEIYAYPGPTDGVLVFNLTTGSQLEIGQGKVWQIIDVLPRGVFASTGSAGGLWLMQFNGTVTEIDASGYWQAVSPDGFAYGTSFPPNPQGTINSIIRYDLANGTTADYFIDQRSQSSVQGFDPFGNPVIYAQSVFGNGIRIWLGTAPNSATMIADLYGDSVNPNAPLISDGHGLWVASSNGITLHVTGVGWYYMSAIGGQLAGGCI